MVRSSTVSRSAPERATTASCIPSPCTVSPPERIWSMKYPDRADASRRSS